MSRTFSFPAALLLAASVFLPAPALAQTQNAIRTNGGFQQFLLAPNDDGSTADRIPLGFNANFFGVTFSSAYVNNNGNITFNAPLDEYDPISIPSLTFPIIAPFWADVDTTGGIGTVRFGRDTVDGRPAFAVTWTNVGYYDRRADLRNTFQLVLIDRSNTGTGNFDIEFNYAQIQWERGQITPTSAEAGYTNGSRTTGRSFRLPGSGVTGAFLDSNTRTGLRFFSLNSTVPGRYVLFARSGEVVQVTPLQLTELRPDRGTAGNQVSLTALGTGFTQSSILILRRNNIETPLTPTTFVSTTELRTTIPASLMNPVGTVDILVQNGANVNACDGTCPRSNARPFIIENNLTLTQIDPDRAPVRAATGDAFEFRLFGTGFATNAQVFFNNTELEVISRTGSTELGARIPASLLAAATVANVSVRNPATGEVAARDSNSQRFTVFIVLTLERLDPAATPSGGANIPLAAFGTGFTANTRIRLVSNTGNFQPSGQTVDVAQGRINATLGAELLTAVTTYRVTAFEGTTNSNSLDFAVTQGHTISSINPTSRQAGSGAFQLTVNGQGFAPGAQVLFGATTLEPQSRTATQIVVSATAPTTAGTLNVSVRQGNVESNRVVFTATAPGPVISSLDPTSRTVNTGPFELRILGQFLTPNPTVTFRGQTAQVTSSTASEIRAQITAAMVSTAGTAQVVVRVNNVDSQPANFSVTTVPLPAITSLTPNTRAASSGDFELTIAGANFGANPTVRFGGQTVGVNGTPTATSIRAQIPNARIQQAGTFPVTVEVPGAGISTGSNFTVTAAALPPPALAVASASVVPGGNTTTSVVLSAAAPVAMTGSLALTFTANATGFAGLTDRALAFVGNGQQTIPFTIAAGQTQAQIAESGRINVGTVAGTISVRIASLTAPGAVSPTLPGPSQIVVPTTAPVFAAGTAKIVNSAGGFNVEAEGHAPSRQMTSAAITFSFTAGTDGSTNTFTVDVSNAFTTFYNSQVGRDNGSRFRLEIPFSVSEGDVNRITGFTMVLTNPAGATTVTGGR